MVKRTSWLILAAVLLCVLAGGLPSFASEAGATEPIVPMGVDLDKVADMTSAHGDNPLGFADYNNWIAAEGGQGQASGVDAGVAENNSTPTENLAAWETLVQQDPTIRLALSVPMEATCSDLLPSLAPSSAIPCDLPSAPPTSTERKDIAKNLKAVVANWDPVGALTSEEGYYQLLAMELDGAAPWCDSSYPQYVPQNCTSSTGQGTTLTMCNAYLKIGAEAEGDWFAWQYGPDPAAWLSYYEDIVEVMHNQQLVDTANGFIDSSCRFKFVQVMGITAYTTNTVGSKVVMPSAVFPDPNSFVDDNGQSYPLVNTLGLDFGDSWTGYGGPTQPAAEQWETAWKNYFNATNSPTDVCSLHCWLDFSSANNVPLALTQWELAPWSPSSANTLTGGGDDTVFLGNLASLLSKHSSQIAFADYFEGNPPTKLSDNPPSETQPADTQMINAPCAFLEDFYGSTTCTRPS